MSNNTKAPIKKYLIYWGLVSMHSTAKLCKNEMLGINFSGCCTCKPNRKMRGRVTPIECCPLPNVKGRVRPRFIKTKLN